jgi:hypothetical protein
VFQVALSCLPYIQSVLNPVIYVAMSKKIRQAIMSTRCLRCLLGCCSRRLQEKRSPTHELLTASTNVHSVAGVGGGGGGANLKTSMADSATLRSYGASELTDV